MPVQGIDDVTGKGQNDKLSACIIVKDPRTKVGLDIAQPLGCRERLER